MPSVSLDAVDLERQTPTKTALKEKLKTSQHEKAVNTQNTESAKLTRPLDELDDPYENNTFTN